MLSATLLKVKSPEGVIALARRIRERSLRIAYDILMQSGDWGLQRPPISPRIVLSSKISRPLTDSCIEFLYARSNFILLPSTWTTAID